MNQFSWAPEGTACKERVDADCNSDFKRLASSNFKQPASTAWVCRVLQHLFHSTATRQIFLDSKADTYTGNAAPNAVLQ